MLVAPCGCAAARATPEARKLFAQARLPWDKRALARVEPNPAERFCSNASRATD